jgi:hypothetical protein
MSETIAEMVLPGTYIEVRSEGLIGVGGIATGVVGIVGTAGQGPVGEVKSVGSYAAAIELFGPPDPFDDPLEADTALSLTRALGHLFAGGASDVLAVRIAHGVPAAASAMVDSASGNPGFTVTALDPGAFGNRLSFAITDAGTSADPRFTMTVQRGVPGDSTFVKETFVGNQVSGMHLAISDENDGSRLISAAEPDPANAIRVLVAQEKSLTGGTSLPNINSVDVATGLALLADQPVNIVVVAGLGANIVGGAVGAHLEQTENEGRERIAVIGARGPGEANDADEVLADSLNDDRIVLVAPGIRETDPATGNAVVLPPSSMAAVVAGKLATLAPHVSLTNKTLPVEADIRYDTAVTKTLLNNRVLVVRRKLGTQIVKGITTDNGAFKQVSIRRVVDFAKAGVRIGSDPYIGKLNNSRVRAALKATLDGFLSQMLVDEFLTAYELDVTATRAEEINGIARVNMTLQPTFSIDFIRVTMTLQ